MKKTASILIALLLLTAMLSSCAAPSPTQPTDTPDTIVQTERLIGTVDDYVRTAEETTMSYDSDITFRLPEILLNSPDAENANTEIMDEYYYLLRNGDAYYGANTLDYEAYLNDKILSVIVTSRFDGGNSYGLVYNFDVTTGERLDNESLCSLTGREYGTVMSDLHDYLTSYYESFGNFTGNDSERERTLSDDNLYSSVIYIGKDDHLMAFCHIYAAIGGGEWVTTLEIE